MSFMTHICYSQKLNKIYYGISSGSLINNHLLEFKNDSTLELSSIRRHMSKQFRMTFNYKKENRVLKIYKSELKHSDSLDLANNGFANFIKDLNFKLENKAILDQNNGLVYVLNNDFKKKHYLTYIINGKEYKLDSGLTNSYGLLEREPKRNKKLERKLKIINPQLENYEINVYKGIVAYQKFGYESVFGVIEMNKKK